jgi:hypothetical protein
MSHQQSSFLIPNINIEIVYDYELAYVYTTANINPCMVGEFLVFYGLI